MNLESIDVAALDVVTALPDLRRDLHVFVDYVRTREVKRSHRGNELSKTDTKRLAKLLSDPEAVQDVDEEGSSRWVAFVDANEGSGSGTTRFLTESWQVRTQDSLGPAPAGC